MRREGEVIYDGMRFNSWRGRVKLLYLRSWLAHLDNANNAGRYLRKKKLEKAERCRSIIFGALAAAVFIACIIYGVA